MPVSGVNEIHPPRTTPFIPPWWQWSFTLKKMQLANTCRWFTLNMHNILTHPCTLHTWSIWFYSHMTGMPRTVNNHHSCYLADVFNSAQAENVYSVHSCDCLLTISVHNIFYNIHKLLIFFHYIFYYYFNIINKISLLIFPLLTLSLNSSLRKNPGEVRL